MKIPLRPHPAYLFFLVPWFVLLFSFTPLDSDYLWIWKSILEIKNGWIFLGILLVGACISFGLSWNIITNCLSRAPKFSIWSNVYWWIFLFALPPFLFTLVFYDYAIPEGIEISSGIIGFLGMIFVAYLSRKFIPPSTDWSYDEDNILVYNPKQAILDQLLEEMTNEIALKDGLAYNIDTVDPEARAVIDKNKELLRKQIKNSLYSNYNKKQGNLPSGIPPMQLKSSPKVPDVPTSVFKLTELLQAVLTGDVDFVKAALENHPEFLNTAYAQNGNTPLHVAALNGYTEIVRLLLAQPGIDKTLKNNDGKTAQDLALEKGFAEIAQMLEK